ncbi:hypothetical protein [Stigmatella aurantiaca]|uniref:Conserved uncharacterized protein n=1 Tax=Stigmatella aurantiaca (strain DW4/3-1) TaxID=378806 RepID=Q095G3_STIAD|nr:hypothetical protein [Stigmatella aurantiaca]ADO74309.1 conserved uncharacterized protein [Stigmatella aurantiaca DW4/3-1]EAU67362.1 hypothetical protein STIAU_7929 [Stigmatella aurantiaca DW4/3-1]
MNVFVELATVLAGLGLAVALLILNAWRAWLFLFPASVRVEPEAPGDQMELPQELEPLADRLLALGFVALGSHEEKPRLRRATRSYDFAHPGERVFATLHLSQEGRPRLYFLTPLASGGFVITAGYKRTALEIPGLYRSGGLEEAPPERLLRAHLKRLEGLHPAGEFTWEGRVETGRSWYRGLGQKEIRRQNLAGVLWTVAAVAILASAFLGGKPQGG